MATVRYITAHNDRLDQICKRHYGTEHGLVVEKVLEFNRDLEEVGVVYPAGVVIFLPEIQAPPAIERKIVQLWDDAT